MKKPIKRISLLALAGGLIFGAQAVSATAAFAYGSADQPIAQVELSGNCNNPSVPLCAPQDQGGVGLGGVWAWAELDSTGTNPTSGTMDATFAGCGHVLGKSSPGTAGAGGGPDPFGVWQQYPSLGDALTANPMAFPFYDTTAYDGSVYLMDFFPGTGSDDFVVVVPTEQGHYSFAPAPGVTLQTQVAP